MAKTDPDADPPQAHSAFIVDLPNPD